MPSEIRSPSELEENRNKELKIKEALDLFYEAGINLSHDEENIITEILINFRDSWGLVIANLYSSKLLKSALGLHAEALIRASEANEKYTKSMTKATWCLVIATVVLAFATIALVYVSLNAH
jgi:hypothetical protein